uniref:CCHC-type domain-containing protein n=1 Tax=Fagus sylvatica TaxID=28930 RepID=A0A2N9E3M7_FAGSY
METEDLGGLPTSGDYVYGSENNELRNSNYGTIDQPTKSDHKEDPPCTENGVHEGDAQNEGNYCITESNLKKDLVDNSSDMETEDLTILPASSLSGGGIEKGIRTSNYSPSDSDSQPNNKLVDNPSIVQVSVELTGNVTVAEELNNFSSKVHAENSCLAVQDESLVGSHKMDGSVKRARMTVDEQQPSVRVMYYSLTRASKQKLEELLQQWSQWNAQHGSSTQDPNEVLESGEEMFFPALHVGLEKKSAVSFWMDNQTGKQQNKEFIPLDGNSVPLYDRGYVLGLTSAEGSSNVEGGLEIIDAASRCFNCGSYSHALKECPKPRNNAAVNNARKQHKSKRNQNAGSRNPTRYYQNTPGGKYDGLRPGALDAETRKLLGLGELDPPPWLNRMREIGYPPGYLDPDDKDQPSGITIYADGEIKEEQEDGEIIEAESSEPRRKMTVEFPGVNGPIPENASGRLWAAGSTSLDHSRNRVHHSSDHYSEPVNRGHHREQRRSRDFTDDGPPGCEPGFSPSMSSYPPRYGGYDSSYNSHSPRTNIPRPRSPPLGRSLSDRGRRSPLVDAGPLNYDSLRWDYGSGRFENGIDESKNDYYQDFSSHSKDTQDRHYHRSRR